MNRKVIFRYYPLIATIGGALWIAVVLGVGGTDTMPLIGTGIVAVLGFCYFVQQQKLSETSLFKELFTEFNRRYDALNERLADIEASETSDAASLAASDRQIIVDYFNLCAEEYLFHSEGYINQAAWRSWCAGMLWYFDREPFRGLWEVERATNSYYGFSPEAIRGGAA